MNIESNGSNLKDTNMTSHKRIDMMMSLVCVAYYKSSLGGFIEKYSKKIHIKKPLKYLLGLTSLYMPFLNLIVILLFISDQYKINRLLMAILSIFDTIISDFGKLQKISYSIMKT